MSADWCICIPTRGRPTKQTTYDNMPQRMKDNTFLFVREDEAEQYRKAGYSNLRIISTDCINLGTTRQYIIRWAAAQRYAHIIMADDDLLLFERSQDGRRFSHIGPSEIHAWSTLIGRLLGFCTRATPIVGIPGRFLANNLPRKSTYNCRISCFFALNIPEIVRMEVSYGSILVQVDIDFTIQILLKGRSSANITEFAHDTTFDQPGGCQLYRTSEALDAASKELARRYPEVVSTFTKRSTTTWKTMGGERTEVRVQWKKAAKLGKERNPCT